MIKTLVIAPYDGLAEVVKKFSNYDNELEINIKVGNLEEGIELAKTAELEGYELIISRGGTANQIKKHVDLPVSDIKISGYDMLRVISLLKNIQGETALVGFPNISRGASTICSILDMNIKTITINSREEVKTILLSLKEKGFSAVIGDVVTVRQAQRIGLQGILITSGKEAVIEAFEEAKNLYYLNQKLQAKASFYFDIIENSPYSTATVNDEGEILLTNKLFKKEFTSNLVEFPELQRFLHNVFLERKSIWNSINLKDKKYYVYGYISSEDKNFATVLLQEQTIQEQQGLEIKNNLSYTPISGLSQASREMRTMLKQYRDIKGPIWIRGETGTGKMTFAHNLHFEKYGPQTPLLAFDLSVISVEEVRRFFINETHLLPKEGTVVFKNAEKLGHDDQGELKGVIDSLVKSYQLLLVSNDISKNSKDSPELNHGLFYKIPELSVHLPPLYERIEDIEELTQAFITQNHMKYGYESIGIRPDALKLLTHYEWPGNIAQLKQAINKITLKNNKPYINQDDVEVTMKELTEEEKKCDNERINVSGSLKDMEKEIILKVMHQENNNQSRAAERLGINRTTLWRKLNS